MLRPLAFFLALLIVFGETGSRASADLIVDSWELESGVSSSSSAWGSNSIVQNPYQQVLLGTLENSFSRTELDFGWSGDSAHFDAITTHHLEQLEGRTISEGRIHLTPSVDSRVTLGGTFQYAWPSQVGGNSLIYLDIYDLTADEDVVYDADLGGNVGLGAPFGTLNVGTSGLLQAGRLYELYYLARIDHFDPTPPGTYGEGSGEIHFNITPVPEPATLSFITMLLLLTRRPRRS